MRKAMLFLAVFGLAGLLFAADAFVGTWKQNVAKSKLANPPPNSQVLVFTAQENGLKLLADGENANGTTFHVEFTAKFDGKDYPLTGSSDGDTIAIEKIDANTFTERFKKAGKEVLNAHLVVSKDGKTLTRTINRKDATGKEVTNIAVFDKQ